MRKLLVLIIFLLSILWFHHASFSQRNYSREAKNAFVSGEYFKAIDLFKYAFGETKDKEKRAEYTFFTAECYRLTRNTKQAEIWYKKAIQHEYKDPVAILYYADMKRANKKYDEAIIDYKTYKKMKPGDPRAENGLKSCDLAKEWLEKPTRYNIYNMAFINSEFNDYAPAYANEEFSLLYFTSSRDQSAGDDIHGATGQSFSDIYFSRQDRKGKWSTPVPLDPPVNGEFSEGTPTLNPKHNTMYFTRCRAEKKKVSKCQIYLTRKKGIGWVMPEKVTLAGDTVTIAHPSLSEDELTLYFSSDMSGGKGRKDIWKTTRAEKTEAWGKPENMGSQINTPGNEMFPYIHADGALYFSSDYHPGMGCLDIFIAKPARGGEWEVENMKYPVNSPQDDFGIIFESDKERGYFSSNRDGGKGINNDDIYSFSLPPLDYQLTGLVRNEKSEEVIPNAKVKLIGSDGVTQEKLSESDGSFSFILKPNTDYVVITEKGGFLKGKGKESTKGVKSSKGFRMDIFMTPKDADVRLAIFYDFGKADLRPESIVALEELVEILNDNPNITIELGAHTDFRGDAAANMDLSERRAKSVMDFLITYGIDEERLSYRGYGETKPADIDKKTARKHEFLDEGDVLTESFIRNLPTERQKEICHQINRRTVFRVTGTDYVPKIRRRD